MIARVEDFDGIRESIRTLIQLDDWFQGVEAILPTKGLIGPEIMKASRRAGYMIVLDGFDLPVPALGCSRIQLPMRVSFFEDVAANRPQSAQAIATAVPAKTLEEMVARFITGLNPVARARALGSDTLTVKRGRYITREKFRTFEIQLVLESGFEHEASLSQQRPAGSPLRQITSLDDSRHLVRDHFTHDAWFDGLEIVTPTDGVLDDAVRLSKANLSAAVTLEGFDINTDEPGIGTIDIPVRVRISENVAANRPQSLSADAAAQVRTLEQVVIRMLGLFHPRHSLQFGGTPMQITKGRYVEAAGDRLSFDLFGFVPAGWVAIS